MSWDKERAACIEHWAKSSRGSFALHQEQRLVQHLIAPWPRRKQKLLDIGCGTGIFLEFFWSCGFDLTAVDSSPDMLAQARSVVGDRVDLHVGRAEHLPFDDREFDYVSLMTVLEFVENPTLALREAFRVARKGVLITFLNRRSVHAWAVRRSKKASPFSGARWFSWLELRGLIQKNMSPGLVVARSVLLGPAWSWSPLPVLRHVNSLPIFPWLGAIGVVRVDFDAPLARPPLMAWNTEPTI